MVARPQRVPLSVSAAPASAPNVSRFLSKSALSTTSSASASPLLKTVKRYTTSEPGRIGLCASASASSCNSDWPKEMSPLQSPKTLKTANIQLRPTMLVLIKFTTLATAYALPVEMLASPSSVNVSFSPVSAETSTLFSTVALFVEDAIKDDELKQFETGPSSRSQFASGASGNSTPLLSLVTSMRVEELVSLPSNTRAQDIPAGSPMTEPLQLPDTRNRNSADVPPK